MRPGRDHTDCERLVDDIVGRLGRRIVLALPLGLGKPVTIVDALVARALRDPELRLEIFTAVTLEPPATNTDLGKRFLDPARERLFGAYPVPAYVPLLREDRLPPNIVVTEFFLQAGQWLDVAETQRRYVSVTYKDALGIVLSRKPNLVAQLLAPPPGEAGAGAPLSMSCNPDITADLIAARARGEAEFLYVGEINRRLPYMYGAALVDRDDVDHLLDEGGPGFDLFCVPKRPVTLQDHAMALRISQLIPDGGTLQIGIGKLGDAIAHALILRHTRNAQWREMIAHVPLPDSLVGIGGRDPFETGLYGLTEMLADAFLHLEANGVLKREIDGAVVDAGFFVDGAAFYETLRGMSEARRQRFRMMPISFTNTLFGAEADKRRARVGARFVNSAMMATMLGAVVSDALEDGRVVSGIGGQLDFVEQAYALDGARSIIALPAQRRSGAAFRSNVVWNYAHTSIPRQLRDIVVTEYGAADLRGRSDRDVCVAMLSIADRAFQAELIDAARRSGKLEPDFRLGPPTDANTTDALETALGPFAARGLLPEYPFGTSFTPAEQRLLPALELMEQLQKSPLRLAELAWEGRATPARGTFEAECLDRVGLADPATLRDRAMARILVGALARTTPHW